MAGRRSAAYVIEAVDWVTANAVKPAVTNMSLGFPLGSGVATAVRGRSRRGSRTWSPRATSARRCLIEPAVVPPAITVAASTITDAQASFSSFGTCVDLYAPGVIITSLGHLSDTGTAVMSGTSMASPHATGVAALYLENHPDASPKKVQKALIKKSTKDVLTGLGAGSPNRLLYSRVW